MPHFQSSFDGAELFFRDYIPSLITELYNSNNEYSDRQQLAINGLQTDRSKIDYEVFAKDIIDLLERIKLRKFIFVAASMASGESLLAYKSSDYVRQHCQGFIFTNTSLLYPTATPEFPQVTPMEMWNQVISAIRQDRVSFFANSFKGPLGIGNNHVPVNTLQRFERMAEAADAIAVERGVQIFARYDFSKELEALGQGSDVPILLLHGDSDVGAPVEVAAARVKQIIPRAKVKVYENASHILIITHSQKILSDIVEFVGSITASVLKS
ncbi:alpha/beta hydrolase fold-containing protein [Leptodontidium sp. MPI-SDFR-AT-0119]|nr:alpha/beta hydrolase fold-containing protein [Leptodontidium sp. MPI-SDFR-AT-0119]